MQVTISTQYLHNIYTVSTQYIHNIFIYRVSSKTVCTCSLFVNCASHADPIIKWSIYFFSWIKIDAKNGITLKN